MTDRVDLTAVEAAAADFDADTGPEDVLALIEALRIARDALLAITGIPPTDDTANEALARMDALVAFTPDPQEASDADA